MSKKHDDHSPVYEYLKGSRSGPTGASNDSHLPATRGALTPQIANSPQMQQYVAYIEKGDPRELAAALVDGRLEQLQQRRDMINFVRQFIGLPPRRLSPAKQIASVTRQLTSLYRQAADMIAAKNVLADTLIDHATKKGSYDLKVATTRAEIAEQILRKRQAQKNARDLEAGAGRADPEEARRQRRAKRREEAQAQREERRAGAALNKDIAEARRDQTKAETETERLRHPSVAPSADQKLEARIRAKNQEATQMTRLKEAQRKACEDAAQAGHRPDSDHYQRIYDSYESEIEQLRLKSRGV